MNDQAEIDAPLRPFVAATPRYPERKCPPNQKYCKCEQYFWDRQLTVGDLRHIVPRVKRITAVKAASAAGRQFVAGEILRCMECDDQLLSSPIFTEQNRLTRANGQPTEVVTDRAPITKLAQDRWLAMNIVHVQRPGGVFAPWNRQAEKVEDNNHAH